MKLHDLADSYARLHQRAEAYWQRLRLRHTVRPPARATRARRPGRATAMRPGFEGGQMPMQRRIPKRGFNNIFAKDDRRHQRGKPEQV